ncbi:MAG TPA: hypothetical protein DCL86_00875 [Bacteroidales bacterium]|nr:hypothetical protein [Bacteroidales bacterium]
MICSSPDRVKKTLSGHSLLTPLLPLPFIPFLTYPVLLAPFLPHSIFSFSTSSPDRVKKTCQGICCSLSGLIYILFLMSPNMIEVVFWGMNN